MFSLGSEKKKAKKVRAISGWILLDKPKFLGSTQAVSKIKRLFQAQKAGHAGTLDPLASGALPIALGHATKTVPYVIDAVKTYLFTVEWGQERTTDDLEGSVTQTAQHRPSHEDIERVLPNFIGKIEQIPPKFSAIKISGKRAYTLAREQKDFTLKSRLIEIYDLKILEMPNPNQTIFQVECSKGTYVRSLARDLGRILSCYGHIVSLHRSSLKAFEKYPLISLDILENAKDSENREDFSKRDGFLLPTQTPLSYMRSYYVHDDQAKEIKQGKAITVNLYEEKTDIKNEIKILYKDALLAIGRLEKNLFYPKRVFV